MLSIEQTKKLLNDINIPDEQVEEIRDGMRLLAEVIFSQWLEEKNKNKQKYETHK